MTRHVPERILQASLRLSASLLEAVDEASILRALMRTGCEVLDARGCIFTPFDEFSTKLPLLEFGDIPGGNPGHISQPELRRTCKDCKARKAGGECMLLHNRLEDSYIYCVPLRERGREAGLFSFVFSSEANVEESLRRFMTESIHLVELSLDARERHRVVQSLQYSKPPSGLDQDPQSFLPLIEYRAIIGERTRLAREIHDGLAQSLAYLKIVIGRAESLLAQGRHDQAAHMLKDSSQSINDIYLDARLAIENLRSTPGHLHTWLVQALEDFEDVSGLPVTLHMDATCDLPPVVQAQVIRIVQEALTNVRKHSQASQVIIEVRQQDRSLSIKVEDDGKGFNPEIPLPQNSFGLRGMRERAEAIGSEMLITSSLGKGTSVNLRIPIFASGN